MLMLRGEFERGVFSHHDPLRPDLDVAVDLSQHNEPKVKVAFDEGKPVIYVNIRLDGTILAIQSRINYEKTDMIGYLEGLIETTIKQEADALIEKAKELNVDFLNFGNYVVKRFSTIQEWEKYNWLEKFKDIKVALKNKEAMLDITFGAFFGPFVGVVLSLVSIKYTSAGVASTISSITPITIIPFSIFILKEKIKPKEIIGAFVTVIGVAILFI
jgi:uncharacterized protein (DUF486 family)